MSHGFRVMMSCTSVILSRDVVEMSLFFDNLRYYKIPFSFSYYFGYLFIKNNFNRQNYFSQQYTITVFICLLVVCLFVSCGEYKKSFFISRLSEYGRLLNANGGNWKWARGVTDDGQSLTLCGIMRTIIFIYDCIMIHLALYRIETSDMIKPLGAGLCQDFPENNCGSFPG